METPPATLNTVKEDTTKPKAQFRTITLRWLLILAFGGLVFVSVASVLSISVVSNFNNTFSLLNARSIALLENMEQDIRTEIKTAERVVTTLSTLYEDDSFDIKTPRSSQQLLRALLLSAPVVEMVRIYLPTGQRFGLRRRANGEFRIIPMGRDSSSVSSGSTFFTSEDLKLGRNPVWGEPVVNNNILFHNVKSVLRKDGKAVGVVVASLGRKSINKIISEIASENNTTAFVLKGKDQLIAHSDNPQFFKKKAVVALKDFPDPILQQLSEADSAGDFEEASKQGISVVESGRGRMGHVFITKPLKGLVQKPYTLGAYYSKHDIGSEIFRATRSAMVGLAALILAVLVAVWISRRISKPMSRIATIATRFSNFDLDNIERLPPSRVYEINEQANAINAVSTAMSEFKRYVPEKLVGRLVASGTEATRSVEREITIMFSDIVGFTTMTEHMNAVETANLLNAHFELVCAEISSNHGTVDKFMGDGMMAFWGAPDADEEHAVHAFQSARAISRVLKENNQKRREEGLQPLRVRIGIHTGRVVIGNIGGGGRQNYTIVGDAVNVAQRLEQMGREWMGDDEIIILASNDTRRAAGGDEGFVSVGSHPVRGRDKPISICRFDPDNNIDNVISIGSASA